MKKKKQQQENNSDNGHSKDGPKQNIFQNYIKEMEVKTKEFIKKNPNLYDIKFYLLQTIQNKNLLRDMIFNLAYFYDLNYTGNKDFIHIPNIKNILDNYFKYPILIASKKDEYGNEDILGASTIKIENNGSISDNPYFPTINENVLTITNILTKANYSNNKKVKGIGKELIKSAIKAYYNINLTYKSKLIYEVDCRNIHSFNAVVNAVKELKEENLNLNIVIDGYYEILNSIGNLLEAPTFILEIDLENNTNMLNEEKDFNYLNCKSSELYLDLNAIIEDNTKEIKQYVNRKDNKIIIYHSLEKINALKVSITPGNTANGNDRVPSINMLEYENINKDLI